MLIAKMKKKFILIFLSILFSFIHLERVCIAPQIHRFLQSYRNALNDYEQNLPCCTKQCEISEEAINPAITFVEEEITEELSTGLNTTQKRQFVCSEDIISLLGLDIKEKEYCCFTPRDDIEYARQILVILNPIKELMVDLILSNCSENKVKKINFVFSDEIDGTIKTFDGTVIELFETFRDRIKAIKKKFAELECELIDNPSADVLKTQNDIKEYMMSFGDFMKDVIENLIEVGACQQHEELISLFNTSIKYFDFFINDEDDIFDSDNDDFVFESDDFDDENEDAGDNDDANNEDEDDDEYFDVNDENDDDEYFDVKDENDDGKYFDVKDENDDGEYFDVKDENDDGEYFDVKDEINEGEYFDMKDEINKVKILIEKAKNKI